jgi:hypothetical protein
MLWSFDELNKNNKVVDFSNPQLFVFFFFDFFLAFSFIFSLTLNLFGLSSALVSNHKLLIVLIVNQYFKAWKNPQNSTQFLNRRNYVESSSTIEKKNIFVYSPDLKKKIPWYHNVMSTLYHKTSMSVPHQHILPCQRHDSLYWHVVAMHLLTSNSSQ